MPERPQNSVNSAAVIRHLPQPQGFKEGVLKAGPAGPAGRAGTGGPAGDPGPAGPVDAFVHFETGPVAVPEAESTTVSSLAGLRPCDPGRVAPDRPSPTTRRGQACRGRL
jgi:hypothetical protein